MESKKLYRFLREAEEVAEWINDQTVIAASEDYGRDVEHVELLIQVSMTIYVRQKMNMTRNMALGEVFGYESSQISFTFSNFP